MELKNISGIGEKTLSNLNKLNIYTTTDLIEYYPYKYNFYNPENINNVVTNSIVTINACIESVPKLSFIRKNFNILRFRVITNNKLINVVIFNRSFIKNKLIVGNEICLIGKYDREKNTFTANNILLSPLKNSIIEPVYHSSSSLKNKNINMLINNYLSTTKVENNLPEYLHQKYNFISEYSALKEIHNPTNIDNLKKSKIVLIYKELFEFMFKINYLRLSRSNDEENIIKNFDENKLNRLIDNLPFTLTEDQLKSLNDIIMDFKSNKRMNRLLIGDVGSGKTIVAILSIYINYLSGYQSAFLAPTEILSNQHYENIIKILPELNIRLLTSSTSKKERKIILNDLNNNKIDCIIGTHSLISEDVVFKNLGLVITDEQHRFGVNQRKNLQNKGNLVDVLYMSATPIPRTYALTIYGDMDISEIKTKPNGRKEIITKLYKEQDLKECLNIMLEELKNNHQIYVIAPLVEENEESNLYDVEKLKEKLNLAFNNKVPIEILHGKLKTTEKDTIMKNFKEGITKILISTTVIEVGVDVKNATCMVIFNAERFGLSTLHQLRGRVGRNNLTSYCLLISNYEKERLDVLTSSTDGFYISEKDFELRGSGNLFGTKQSGQMNFKLADIRKDIKILKQCDKDSKEFIEQNKDNNFINYPHYIEILNSIKFID